MRQDPAVTRKRVVVRGLVQGVFFRDTCRREAARLGVTGWVRNCRDGSVEAVFEGAPEAVEAMVRWSGQGPSTARVEQVETYDEEPRGATGFAVR